MMARQEAWGARRPAASSIEATAFSTLAGRGVALRSSSVGEIAAIWSSREAREASEEAEEEEEEEEEEVVVVDAAAVCRLARRLWRVTAARPFWRFDPLPGPGSFPRRFFADAFFVGVAAFVGVVISSVVSAEES